MIRESAALILLLGSSVFAQQRPDAQRGASIFEGKGACLNCHRVKDKGTRLGVDLTTIGILQSAASIEKAILDPNPDVQVANRTYRVVTQDGAIHTGKLLNQDTATIQMLDSKERLVTFQRTALREQGFATTPPMPSYRNKLTPQETADLVAYLASLKGVVAQ